MSFLLISTHNLESQISISRRCYVQFHRCNTQKYYQIMEKRVLSSADSCGDFNALKAYFTGFPLQEFAYTFEEALEPVIEAIRRQAVPEMPLQLFIDEMHRCTASAHERSLSSTLSAPLESKYIAAIMFYTSDFQRSD